MSYLEIGLLIVLIWIIAMIALRPTINKSKHFQTMGGILLLIKVKKNRGILDRIAGSSKSKLFSRLSIPLVYILFAMGIVLLVLGTVLSLTTRVKENIPVSEYLALPGIDPEIPIVYGLIAFAISLVIHEMFHGIVARKHGIKVNSVGLMLFVVPIGAFVEPDEKEITETTPVIRRRIVGAGIAVNFVIAIICFLFLSLAMSHAAVQTYPGAYVDAAYPGNTVTPHNITGSELLSVGNMKGNSLVNLTTSCSVTPGTLLNASFYNGHKIFNYSIPAGIQVVSTYKGYPAYKNISLGDYIISVNNRTVYNETVLGNILNKISPGTEITVGLENFTAASHEGIKSTVSFKTRSTYSFYKTEDPSLLTAAMKNESFIGVGITYGGLGLVSMSYYKSLVFGSSVYTSGPEGAIESIALPFDGLSPVPSSFAHLYSVPLGYEVFWFSTNTIYWLFWVNILLAITNALPLAIFDGAQFLRDTLMIASKHERFKYFRDEKNIAAVLSLTTTLILLMLMIEIIVPRII
ncbi:site-2 protease family protein [Cuniculiplasma divulgatum]|uniref:Intramembrane-cleaving zinc metalloprotease S2P n=1 Tax=Cuniculiplasma divulgatum TaxID=1673428 RepID=A0A1N5VJT5_9ARCH|nr:site-2 protease family protein [Cuniculiplasma divulgatum]SIM72515.1 intramembrane-cleaving zinc metalloprotease S2P [Cuniculiplasma divulgatum]SJK85181.1 intramembrane-cleaving zinc metalloprotease S2P [Cuniculiplasma divulgatum]